MTSSSTCTHHFSEHPAHVLVPIHRTQIDASGFKISNAQQNFLIINVFSITLRCSRIPSFARSFFRSNQRCPAGNVSGPTVASYKVALRTKHLVARRRHAYSGSNYELDKAAPALNSSRCRRLANMLRCAWRKHSNKAGLEPKPSSRESYIRVYGSARATHGADEEGARSPGYGVSDDAGGAGHSHNHLQATHMSPKLSLLSKPLAVRGFPNSPACGRT